MAGLRDLVGYVIREAQDRGFQLLKTQLVKLLYLADVEALRSGMPRITDVQWVFYKYGPYAAEVDRAIRELVGVEVQEIEGVSARGRAYRRYTADPAEDHEAGLAPWEKVILGGVLDRWLGEDLNRLLDHVYFETEPMLEAEWGKPLDLSLVQPRRPGPSVRWTAELEARLRELRQRLRRKAEEELERAKRDREAHRPRYDDLFFEAMEEDR